MKKSVAIIGGGPAALLFAAFVDTNKFDVTIYEKNKTLGRKFLVAGKGGFNLSHGEEMTSFIERYTPSLFLKEALKNFTNDDLRNWFNSIGIPTFIGSSNRIYPEKGIKPIEVLEAITSVLKKKGIQFKFGHEWKGWSENNALLFNDKTSVQPDITIFALGGGSWKVTGSGGSWLSVFKEKGIKTKEFSPANCAYKVEWATDFIHQYEGQPIKNSTISCSYKTQKGEFVLTQFGIEGNAIYGLTPQVQAEITKNGIAEIKIDLKPQFSVEKVLKNLLFSQKMTKNLQNELKLSKTQIGLLKSIVSKEDFLIPEKLAYLIKHLPITLTQAAPIDEAISTTGGIDLSAVDNLFQLKSLPNTYCIGEMLDWNAPTGGYLLQGCFSMGVFSGLRLH